jgi:hypothetical protein
MDPFRRGQCPTVGRLGDEAHLFADANAMKYALACVIGDEGGPDQVGQIRDFGEGLAILHHVYRGGTWTRVMERRA